MSDVTTALKEITAWPVHDQIELLHQMWDHLVESGSEPELTDVQKAEFDRRLEAADKNPDEALTWDEIVKHMRATERNSGPRNRDSVPRARGAQ